MRWSLYKKEAKASGIKNAVANQHFRTPRTNTKKMWSDCHESQKNCLLNLMEYHTTHTKKETSKLLLSKEMLRLMYSTNPFNFDCRYTVSVRVEEKQPYRQRTYTWCWAFPPRCSKYKIQIKTIYRTEVSFH